MAESIRFLIGLTANHSDSIVVTSQSDPYYDATLFAAKHNLDPNAVLPIVQAITQIQRTLPQSPIIVPPSNQPTSPTFPTKTSFSQIAICNPQHNIDTFRRTVQRQVQQCFFPKQMSKLQKDSRFDNQNWTPKFSLTQQLNNTRTTSRPKSTRNTPVKTDSRRRASSQTKQRPSFANITNQNLSSQPHSSRKKTSFTIDAAFDKMIIDKGSLKKKQLCDISFSKELDRTPSDQPLTTAESMTFQPVAQKIVRIKEIQMRLLKRAELRRKFNSNK